MEPAMLLMFQPLARYVDFQGRARRSEYWLWALFLFLLNSALTLVQTFSVGAAGVASVGTANAAANPFAVLGLMSIVKVVVFLALLLPSIAVSVRRMHDIDRTGWWIIMPTTVFLLAFIAVIALDGGQFINEMKALGSVAKSGYVAPGAGMAMAMAILRPLLWAILLSLLAKLATFIFRVSPGTVGPNRFGPDPKGQATDIAKVFDIPEPDREPHTPIFDFSSGPKPAPASHYSPSTRPLAHPASGSSNKPTFGKRR